MNVAGYVRQFDTTDEPDSWRVIDRDHGHIDLCAGYGTAGVVHRAGDRGCTIEISPADAGDGAIGFGDDNAVGGGGCTGSQGIAIRIRIVGQHIHADRRVFSGVGDVIDCQGGRISTAANDFDVQGFKVLDNRIQCIEPEDCAMVGPGICRMVEECLETANVCLNGGVPGLCLGNNEFLCVGAAATGKLVVAEPAIDQVVTGASVGRIIAACRKDAVVPTACEEHHGAVAAGRFIVMPAAEDEPVEAIPVRTGHVA